MWLDRLFCFFGFHDWAWSRVGTPHLRICTVCLKEQQGVCDELPCPAGCDDPKEVA